MKKKSSIAIQKAVPGDIFTLVALMRLFYAESGYFLDEKWAAESFETLLNRPSLGSVWLAMDGKADVGYVVLTVRYGMGEGGMIGIIDDLFVRSEYRRRHAAAMLLETLFAECRALKCKAIHVEAGAWNTAGMALYEKFGLSRGKEGRLLLSVPL